MILFLAVLTPLTGAGLILLHTPHVNGPDYWPWPYRRLAALPLYPLCWFLGAVTVWAGAMFGRGRLSATWALGIGAGGALGLMVGASLCDTSPPSLTAFREVVIDPAASTYLSDAARISRDIQTPTTNPAAQPTLSRFVRNYQAAMVRMGTHSRIRGPGWVLFYMGLLYLTGNDIPQAAAMGGAVLAVLAAGAVPLTAWLIRTMGGTKSQAVYGGLLLSLCPAMLLFFPMVDPGYCAVTALLCGTWCLACRTGRWVPAGLTGLLMGLVCFFTYNFLALGIFLLAITAYPLWFGDGARRVRTVLLCGLAAVAAAAPYVPLCFLTGFDPIATFRKAIAIQREFEHTGGRADQVTALYDFYDHALGAAFVIPLLCIGWWLTRHSPASGGTRRFTMWAAFAALLQFVVLGVSQQMPVETARVWLFVNPLILLPAAIFFARLPSVGRVVVLATMAFVVPVYAQNLQLAGHDFAKPFLQKMIMPSRP